MVSKLVKRGFVKKEISPKTDNEIILTLTETGKNIYDTHEKQHQQLKAKLAEIFEKYPTGTLDTLMKIGTDLISIWETASKQ